MGGRQEGVVIQDMCWEVVKCHRPGAQGWLHCLERHEVSREFWGTREPSSGKAMVPGRVTGTGNIVGDAC